jgi:hypothetical protein
LSTLSSPEAGVVENLMAVAAVLVVLELAQV